MIEFDSNENFQKNLIRGRYGEELVIKTFSSLGYEIKDTSKDDSYFNQDVDLITADGIKYEVKTDYRFGQTGNLALEDSVYYHSSQEEKNSWLWTSKADYFCFVSPADTKFVTIEAKVLRHLVRHETLRDTYLEGGYKSTHLILLPYRRYKSLFQVIDTEV